MKYHSYWEGPLIAKSLPLLFCDISVWQESLHGLEIKSSIGSFREKRSQSPKIKAKQTRIVPFPTWDLPSWKVWISLTGPSL